MEIAEHITAVEVEAELFAEAVRKSGLEADIAGCRGWNMRVLVRHLSEIHLWAAAIVAQRTSKLWPEDPSVHTESWPDLAVSWPDLAVFWPSSGRLLAVFWPDDSDLIDWYLETNVNLVRCLEAASPADDIPYFLKAPSPLAMWALRQAHEIAMHRFDAQNASGAGSGFDPVFAADGIDEAVDASTTRANEFPTTSVWTMVVHAQDTDDLWHLTITPDGITTVRGDGPADVALSGAASDLLLVLSNRTEDSTITVDGDHDLLNVWHTNVRRRWTFTTDYS